MAKKTTIKKKTITRRASSARSNTRKFDMNKFDNVHQVGGIVTGSFDAHAGMGPGQGCRVALVNTGSGLRFTVALDRGGDIVDAWYNNTNLAYLTQVGYRPPSHAFNTGLEWLSNWPGGLMTTCGPEYMGSPRHEDGVDVTLHGHHSNNPAALEMVLNPDPHRGRNEMLLSMVTRQVRMFGPNIEVRRQIQCVLGVPEIRIFDQVTNRNNTKCAHHWLYHINPGYPLLDRGCKFVYKGNVTHWPAEPKQSAAQLTRWKTVTDPLPEHVGSGERGIIVQLKPDRTDNAHVGIINPKLTLGMELEFPVEQLPRIANWQHYGPAGCYITGIEPFNGSLTGKAEDDHPRAEQFLKPGQTMHYRLTIRFHANRAALAKFAKHDGKITV